MAHIDFDRLTRASFAVGATRADMDALWRAAFSLDEWLFIARGELPNIRPYVSADESVAGGAPMLKAFTDSTRLQRFARDNGLTSPSGDVPMLSIPIAGALAFAQQFAEAGVHGIHFNADRGSDGFFAPLVQLPIVKRHLDTAAPAPPTKPPDGSKSPLFATFLELANNRIGWPVVFQRLAEHRGYQTPVTKLPDGKVVPYSKDDGPYRTLLAFSAEPPLDAWIFAGNKADAYATDVSGMSLFGDLPDEVTGIDIDVASPLPLRLHGDAVRGLRRAARGVQAVHALKNLGDRSLARLALRYDGYRALLQHHRGATTPLTLPDAQGRPFAVVVTNDLALESFLAVWPHLRSMLVLSAWMDGSLVFRQVPSLGVAGVVVDPHTPGMAVVPLEACAAILAAPPTSPPPVAVAPAPAAPQQGPATKTSDDGLVVVPDFGNGWRLEEQVLTGATPLSMQKCKRVAPNNDFFLFMLAKQYEVGAEHAASAEDLTKIYRTLYEKNFTNVHTARTEWVESEGRRWYEATYEMTHPKMGVISKIERVHAIGAKVFLVSAEGRKDDMRAHHSFVQRWMNECRFTKLAAAAEAADAAARAAPPPASPGQTRAALEAELEAQFEKSIDLYAAGRLAQAKEVATAAHLRARADLGDDHRLSFVGFAQLGELHRAMGQLAIAGSMLEHALKLGDKHYPAGDPHLTRTICNLGRVRLDEENVDAAQRLFADALERSRARAPRSPEVAIALSSLGYVEILRGDFPKAESLLREALSMLVPPALPPDHPEALRTLHNLGRAIGQGGRLEESESLLVKALDGRRAILGPDHPETIESTASLGTLYFVSKRPERAAPLYQQALEATRRVHGDDHLFVADRLIDVALNANALGDSAPALPALEEAYKIRRRRLGADHPRTVWIRDNLAGLRRALGLPEVSLDGPVSLDLSPDHIIEYHTGSASSPTDPWGAVLLTIHGDGRVALYNKGRAGERRWEGRVETSTVQELLSALKAAGFPEVKKHMLPAGSSMRVVGVQAAGREGHTLPIAYHSTHEIGYGPVFHLLDGIVVQMGGGALGTAPTGVPGLVKDVRSV